MTLITPVAHLSMRSCNVLRAAGIHNFEQLAAISDRELLMISNLGKQALLEIRLAELEYKRQAPSIEPAAKHADIDARDYFAAAALPALIDLNHRQAKANGDDLDLHSDLEDDTSTHDAKWLCETAYDIADQMLYERRLKAGDR